MSLRLQAGLMLCLLLPGAAAAAQSPAPNGNAPAEVRRSDFQRDTDMEREKARQQIGMSVLQQEQLERLYAEADKREKSLGKLLHDLYDQQRALYANYVIDHVQERDLHKKIDQMHHQLLQIHADTENGLRKILTHEQFDRLNAALNEHRRENRRDRERHTGGEKAPRQNDGDNHREEKPSPSLDRTPGTLFMS